MKRNHKSARHTAPVQLSKSVRSQVPPAIRPTNHSSFALARVARRQFQFLHLSFHLCALKRAVPTNTRIELEGHLSRIICDDYTVQKEKIYVIESRPD